MQFNIIFTQVWYNLISQITCASLNSDAQNVMYNFYGGALLDSRFALKTNSLLRLCIWFYCASAESPCWIFSFFHHFYRTFSDYRWPASRSLCGCCRIGAQWRYNTIASSRKTIALEVVKRRETLYALWILRCTVRTRWTRSFATTKDRG